MKKLILFLLFVLVIKVVSAQNGTGKLISVPLLMNWKAKAATIFMWIRHSLTA